MDPQSKRISDMISALAKIALADGKITKDEKTILESVQINLMMYDSALDTALEDGIIDDSEKDFLNGLKMQILGDAWDIAKVSEGVSDDELKLLEVLLNKLSNGGN